MQFTTTVTQKGQVTIPKHLRERFGIRPYDTVLVEQSKTNIVIKPAVDILDLAGTMAPSRKKPLLKARKQMERQYSRI
ncbi:AbrB/MazE/SpoVT family DNA-binding domain-containing protein [Candidatus Roizmanbacteria bacterium]|nr:AbrB/MazE/SpoVT family DNA-binding domain-containing protein [Candidatus Roizmanbacteria bacterium]